MRGKKKELKYYILAGACLCLFIPNLSKSQEHLVHKPENSWLRLTEDQFAQGHYDLVKQSAAQYFRQHDQALIAAPSDGVDKLRYLLTLSLLRLDEVGADDSARHFISSTPDPAYQQRTSFALAQYYFRNGQLAKAVPYYQSANIGNLTNQEIADSKFELAYCYFNSRQFEMAAPLFASIKEVPGKYYVPGNYYFGLLAYNNSNYPEALASFKRIENEKQYSPIVPYYIAEIHYFSGEKAKALAEAERLIRKPEKLFYDNELHLLAAQVLFEDQKYVEALPYFEYYYDNVDKIRKEELYEMAYTYYRTNAWKKAIDKFKLLNNTQDSLGQTAMYLLGDSYLKTGDKKSARNAFGFAADMPYNKGQQEASLLLYGKLSYETGYSDEAARSFTALIREFPESANISEAKTLLSDILTRTNNYADAYEMLKGVTAKDNEYWRVNQKVSYGYAIQQLQSGNLHYADNLLAISLKKPVDNYYEAAASFWRGDIAYKQNKPQEARTFLLRYLNMAESDKGVQYISPQANLQNAYIDLGYASMELEDYAAAQNYFSKAKLGIENSSSSLAHSAELGEANAVFMQKNYAQASALYDKIIGGSGNEAEYAKLQKAILSGIQGKKAEKITLLQQLVKMQPPSPYSNDAAYELALTYIEDDKYQQAITVLQPLTTAGEGKNLASKAWLRLGFSYQQLNNDTKAIESYKHVITDFPASEDRSAALGALRSLYIENNQPEAYANLLKTFNLPQDGKESMDTTYYSAAETQFAAGKYENASTSFAQYLEKYPNGAFVTRAHYYKAESHFQLKEYKDALASYDALLALPWSEFTENSAKRAAQIAFQEGDLANALRYYQQLRNSAMGKENLQLAYSGLMKSAYGSASYEKAASYADTLLTMPELSASIQSDVQFLKAKSLQRQNKNEEALVLYKQLGAGRNDAIASEAKYHIAEIYFAQDNMQEAEAAAGEAIKLTNGNEYWVVKSYLLITDILIKQKDFFNARATLQSIIKNTKNADLKKEANAKLEQVKTLEKQQSKLTEE